AYGRQQLLEARSGDPAAGAAKIIVDHLNVAPTEQTSTLDERVSTSLTLEIVRNLIGCRLANVDDCAALEVLSGDLAHRRAPGCTCRRLYLTRPRTSSSPRPEES